MVVHELDIDDHGVPGDCVPRSPEIGFGEIESPEQTVHMDVPAAGLFAPLNLGERTAAVDSLPPKRPGT